MFSINSNTVATNTNEEGLIFNEDLELGSEFSFTVFNYNSITIAAAAAAVAATVMTPPPPSITIDKSAVSEFERATPRGRQMSVYANVIKRPTACVITESAFSSIQTNGGVGGCTTVVSTNAA